MFAIKKIPLFVLLANFSPAVASEVTKLISFPRASEVELFSDSTERGGATEAIILDDPNTSSLIFRGVLRGVITESGRRVGFAGVRIPLVLAASVRQIYFILENPQRLRLRAVFTTSNREAEGIVGQLSYQAILGEDSETGLIGIDLSQLTPTVRGRELERSQAPAFLPEQVEGVAIELKLSEQSYGQRPEGVPFSIIFPYAG